MERIVSVVPWAIAFIGGWTLLNGLLHDVFVLAQGRKYDRDLLRLLLDGHVLITNGLVLLLASYGIWKQETWGILLAALASCSVLVYCSLIFPFLKSFGMMGLHFSGLLLLAFLFIHYKNK